MGKAFNNHLHLEEECTSECYDDFAEESSLPPAPLYRASKASTQAGSSHTVFVLDVSGSMRTRDVNRGKEFYSRLDAVFDCVSEFVSDQIQSGTSGAQNTCTIITFNDDAYQWTGFPNPPSIKPKLLKTIDNIRWSCCAELGTKYLRGLQKALSMCSHMSRHGGSQTVVFLSDGKPGDLNFGSRNEVELMSVMQQLKVAVQPGRINFHSIGFGMEANVWLRKMAACVGGQFHDQQVGAGGFSYGKMTATFRSISSAVTSARSGTASAGMAVAHGMGSTTAANTRLNSLPDMHMSKMRFHVLTYVDAKGTFCDGFEIDVLVSRDPFAIGVSIKAYLVTLPMDGQPLFKEDDLIDLMETLDVLNVGIAKGLDLVGKEQRYINLKEEGLTFHAANFGSLLTAKGALSAFKKTVTRAPRLPPAYEKVQEVNFLNCYFLRSQGHPRRYLSIEQHLKGSYTKHNGNDGYVRPGYKTGEMTERRRFMKLPKRSHISAGPTAEVGTSSVTSKALAAPGRIHR